MIPFDILLREFQPKDPWMNVTAIDNKDIARVAATAIDIMNRPIHIIQLEKFNRSFTQ